MIEDTWLIWRLRNGHEDGFVRTYAKYRNYLLKIAYSMLDDGQQSEDAVQDVFVSLAESAHRLRLNGNLKGYLARCLVNRVRNMRKARDARPTVPLSQVEEPGSHVDRPDQWVLIDEQTRRLHDAVHRLPDEQRDVITLHIHGGLAFRQIAKLQDTSINTAQSRYRYGLKKLRFLLNGERS